MRRCDQSASTSSTSSSTGGATQLCGSARPRSSQTARGFRCYSARPGRRPTASHRRRPRAAIHHGRGQRGSPARSSPRPECWRSAPLACSTRRCLMMPRLYQDTVMQLAAQLRETAWLIPPGRRSGLVGAVDRDDRQNRSASGTSRRWTTRPLCWARVWAGDHGRVTSGPAGTPGRRGLRLWRRPSTPRWSALGIARSGYLYLGHW